jgi:hypothetical protein
MMCESRRVESDMTVEGQAEIGAQWCGSRRTKASPEPELAALHRVVKFASPDIVEVQL